MPTIPLQCPCLTNPSTQTQIQRGAQELLRFAEAYQQHRDSRSKAAAAAATPLCNTTATSTDTPSATPLPPEIDMLSLTQLSWGLLHAVGDINNHNQRLLLAAARDDWYRRKHNLHRRHHSNHHGQSGLLPSRVKSSRPLKRVCNIVSVRFPRLLLYVPAYPRSRCPPRPCQKRIT